MSNQTIKFSVLMSVYHKENPIFLRNAIESVSIKQTIKPNEIVLIQDGPLTDELYQVIRYFESELPYFKTYSMEKNSGLGKALEYGVMKCTYDWIARMDSDDISIPDRFEKQVEFLKQHKNIDVLGSNITEFGENPEDVISIKRMPNTHADIRAMLRRRTPICHVTAFIRKEKLLAAGGYQDLPYVEDYYLWARMFVNSSQFASVDESLVLVRVGNGMLARRGNKQQILSWKILNNYMYKNGLVSYLDVIINKFLIRMFLYMPVKMKEVLYKKVLRKR